MNTLATLIAIAAWCGQPITTVQYIDTHYYTARQADQCRQEIWACLQKSPHSPQCFLNEKLDAQPKEQTR